jgi:hypothetical protein
LIIFLIVLVQKLIVTLKSANAVLKDVETISAVAAKRATDVDEMVDGIVDSVDTIRKNLKGQQGVAKVISSVVGLITTLKGFFNKKGNKD